MDRRYMNRVFVLVLVSMVLGLTSCGKRRGTSVTAKYIPADDPRFEECMSVCKEVIKKTEGSADVVGMQSCKFGDDTGIQVDVNSSTFDATLFVEQVAKSMREKEITGIVTIKIITPEKIVAFDIVNGNLRTRFTQNIGIKEVPNKTAGGDTQ
jgi:hypothetical protein